MTAYVANGQFGAQLRAARKAAGFGLRELARRVGISPPFLSDIELGRRLPSDDVLLALTSTVGASNVTMRNGVIEARIELLRNRIAELESKKTRARKPRSKAGE